MPTPRSAHSDVLVVGGGFAGLYAAKVAAHHGCAVTLVDTRGIQSFQPLLYQVATGQVPVDVVDYPLDELHGVAVVAGEVTMIDLNARVATLADGSTLSADYLVLATGAAVNYFGVPGAKEHALPLYTSANAVQIKARIQQLVEANRDFTVAVIGAGATGVEFAGALGDVIDGALPRTYPHFKNVTVSVHVVDRGTVPVAHMKPESQQAVTTALQAAGVHGHLGRSVTQVRPDGVDLDDGTSIDCDLVVWSGGISAAHPELSPAPPTGHGGRITINADLRIPGHDRVYCIGDTSATGESPLPQLGSVAKQQGIHAAHSIRRQRSGKEPREFRYIDLGDMVMIRFDQAAVEMGPSHLVVTGQPAFAMWLGLHAALLPDSERRRYALHHWFDEARTGTVRFLPTDVPAAAPGRLD